MQDDPASGHAESSDPWLHGKDPWSQARLAPSSSAAVPSAAAASKIEQVAEELGQNVKAVVQQQLAEQPSSASAPAEKRLQQLESGLQEVRIQNQKCESWFQTFGANVSNQAQEIKDIAKSVQQQQTEFGQLRGEVKSTVACAVAGMQQEMTSQISTQLASQFEKIQALFQEGQGVAACRGLAFSPVCWLCSVGW